jgi:preprotein translocase subunit YajC
MSSENNNSDTIVSQETTTPPKAPDQIQSSLSSIVPMVLIFAVFYFLLLRPQEKRRRAQEDLVKGVKKGEEVSTNSGIFGTVTKINDSDHTVELEIAKDTQIKILKTAISDIISRKKEEKPKKVTKGSSSAKTS